MTLNYGNYGILPSLGDAGFISSTVGPQNLFKKNIEAPKLWSVAVPELRECYLVVTLMVIRDPDAVATGIVMPANHICNCR